MTYRQESAILALVERGLTYAAIARALDGEGVTPAIARNTARRCGVHRQPGRPRASDPDRIPSAVPPVTRW